MKKKDLKLVMIGAIVILVGALMFFDKIAEIAKLDTTQMPFSIVDTISTPFVGIRKSIRQENLIDAKNNEINEQNERNNQLQKDLNNTKNLNENYDKKVKIYYGECTSLYGEKDFFGKVLYKPYNFYYAEGKYFNTLKEAEEAAHTIKQEYLDKNYKSSNVNVIPKQGVRDNGRKFSDLNSLKRDYGLK